jgi:hypothetical protein
MSAPPETPSLGQLQSAFATNLRAAAGQPGAAHPLLEVEILGAAEIPVSDRLGIYRNNARLLFRTALERTYRVVRLRVGEDYFNQLAQLYRAAHPSSHGDLHWVGQSFPEWLARHTRGSGYEWLPDLARLEWACESALVCAETPPIALGALAEVPSDRLDDLRLGLQPSMHLVASAYPVWSVWQANQGSDPGAPTDMAMGAEHCVVACAEDGVVVYRVTAEDFSLLERLTTGSTLGAAVAETDYDLAGLPSLFAWLFAEGLVVELKLDQSQTSGAHGISPCAPASR